MALKAGTIIFWTQDCADGRAEARAWLKAKGYTPQQVFLTELGGEILATLRVKID